MLKRGKREERVKGWGEKVKGWEKRKVLKVEKRGKVGEKGEGLRLGKEGREKRK